MTKTKNIVVIIYLISKKAVLEMKFHVLIIAPHRSTQQNVNEIKPNIIFYKYLFQILTDAALLKRQKLEIEELRNKLQVIFLVYIVLTVEITEGVPG